LLSWVIQDQVNYLIHRGKHEQMNNIEKRLIEISLPLAKISEQSAREKSIRHGHISTLHIWWARRPISDMPVIYTNCKRFAYYLCQGIAKINVTGLVDELARDLTPKLGTDQFFELY